MRLSTDKPSWNTTTDVRRDDDRAGTTDTHASAMLDELLAIYLVEPPYPNVVAFGVDQSVAQVFVLLSHGFQHDLCAG